MFVIIVNVLLPYELMGRLISHVIYKTLDDESVIIVYVVPWKRIAVLFANIYLGEYDLLCNVDVSVLGVCNRCKVHCLIDGTAGKRIVHKCLFTRVWQIKNGTGQCLCCYLND